MSFSRCLRSGDRPALWVVLDAAVLLRSVGVPVVMREQLPHLLRVAAMPHVTLHVLPFDQGEHDVMGGSLTLLTMPDGSGTACAEGAHDGQLVEDDTDVRRFALT
ncbi:hypothetical protein GCM10020256_34070 [Streptomyces thermocoprophilus]|jgi:hypothetical protein